MISDLEGSVALVTGGASGIGRGICRVLASQGAAIAVADMDPDGAEVAAGKIREEGGSAVAVEMNVAEKRSVTEAVSAAEGLIGEIDVLVNNAGVIGAPGWQERVEVTGEDWEFTLRVNLIGTVNVTEAIEEGMTRRRRGSIVNIASIAGWTGNPDRSSYNASKAAVISYTRSMALRLARDGITVNCVCPGMIWTPMWEKISARQFAFGSEVFTDPGEARSNRELFDHMINVSTPLGRPQDPEDVGHAVAFFASPRARNITGQSLNVDGGRVMG